MVSRKAWYRVTGKGWYLSEITVMKMSTREQEEKQYESWYDFLAIWMLWESWNLLTGTAWGYHRRESQEDYQYERKARVYALNFLPCNLGLLHLVLQDIGVEGRMINLDWRIYVSNTPICSHRVCSKNLCWLEAQKRDKV